MTTERKALLRAIRKQPDDRTARLVYADWLDEHDDPLARYVRAECAVMAAAPGSKAWKSAMKRLLAGVEKAGTNLGGWEYAEDVARLRELRDSKPYSGLKPVVREPALIRFELRNGITLPGEYRAFLLQIGNGWTRGRENGIIQFDARYKYHSLARPFSLTRADALEMLNEMRHSYTPKGYNPPDWVKHRKYTFDGCVLIADFGCGNEALIVVNGELRGQVWSCGDVRGPWADDGFTRLFGFFDWFEPVFTYAPW